MNGKRQGQKGAQEIEPFLFCCPQCRPVSQDSGKEIPD